MNQKVIYISVIVVAILLGAGFFLLRSQSLGSKGSVTPFSSPSSSSIPEVSNTPKSTSSSVPSASPAVGRPVITTPQPSTRVSSPLMVKGTVPPGWMFEGVFPIKLLDANRNVITQSQAKEVTPGSWSSGNDVEFSTILNFTTNAKTGFIVLEKDNLSGLPENADSFEIPINF